jgi:hypothetical protein
MCNTKESVLVSNTLPFHFPVKVASTRAMTAEALTVTDYRREHRHLTSDSVYAFLTLVWNPYVNAAILPVVCARYSNGGSRMVPFPNNFLFWGVKQGTEVKDLRT